MTWWFKRYPELLKTETIDLSSNSNYQQKFIKRDNLLVSCGKIIVRLGETIRYPIIIVYHPSTPYVLPTVFILNELLTESEVTKISSMEYSEISNYLKDKTKFLYLRHQGSDGSICFLEQDNLEKSGIEYFSATQIINRLRAWLAGITTGKFPLDSSEVELYAHFKRKNPNINILYPEIFIDDSYKAGIFYLSLMSHLSRSFFNHEKLLYAGVLIEPQTEAGLFLPTDEYIYSYLKKILGFNSYIELTTNENKLKGPVSKGELIKGYWWEISIEPYSFKNIDEFISLVGNGNYDLGMKRIFVTAQTEFKSLNDYINIAVRYSNRKNEKEWQFFRLVKTKSEHLHCIGIMNIDHIRELMNNYEIEAIHSELFSDKYFHRRNSLLAKRDKLKNSKINIIGCGALGSEIADIISKAGVDEINLIDKENVNAGNVIRHLASLQFVGYPKTFVVEHIISNHNPFILVNSINVDILQSNVVKYLLDDSISISSIADDNTEGLLNEQAMINNKIIFYSRILRGGKAARIFRVIPGKDACFNCLLLYSKEGDKKFPKIPEDETLPIITNECNNPIRPASAAEIKLGASLTSKIIINNLQDPYTQHNHWILLSEALEGFSFSENEYIKVFSDFIPPHKNCIYCKKEDPIEINLPDSVLEFMINETKKNVEIETGGILIGYKKNDGSINVTLASEPGPDATKEKSLFIKDKNYCQNILDESFENSGSKNVYVGEWHYHPCQDNNPSNTDLKSLSDISSQKEYITTKPIMIILSNNGKASCTIHPVDKPFYKAKINDIKGK